MIDGTMKYMESEKNNKTFFQRVSEPKYLTILGLAIITVIVLLGIWVASQFDNTTAVGDADPVQQADFEAGTEPTIETIDLSTAETDEAKLPVGFPTDLPLEYDNINESLSTTYSGDTTAQGSVVFDSPKTYSELRSDFDTYFEDNGYTVTVNELQEGAIAQLRGENESGELLSVLLQRVSDQIVTVKVGYRPVN